MKQPAEDQFKPVNVVRYLVPAGTSAVIATAGGGGWGQPFRREPELVRQDVLDGYVTLESAARDYGVVLDPETLGIDAAATEALRR
jgi:N-methylhydantoinase B/oxoprolinase/acetone carboxylase alpha subunit